MAVNHDLHLGKLAFQPLRPALARSGVVHDGQPNLFKLQLQAERQGKAMVIVAQDGVHGHDPGDGLEQKLLHHVAGVYDGVRLFNAVPDNLRQIRRPGAFRRRYMGVGKNG